MKQSISSEGG